MLSAAYSSTMWRRIYMAASSTRTWTTASSRSTMLRGGRATTVPRTSRQRPKVAVKKLKALCLTKKAIFDNTALLPTYLMTSARMLPFPAVKSPMRSLYRFCANSVVVTELHGDSTRVCCISFPCTRTSHLPSTVQVIAYDNHTYSIRDLPVQGLSTR